MADALHATTARSMLITHPDILLISAEPVIDDELHTLPLRKLHNFRWTQSNGRTYWNGRHSPVFFKEFLSQKMIWLNTVSVFLARDCSAAALLLACAV